MDGAGLPSNDWTTRASIHVGFLHQEIEAFTETALSTLCNLQQRSEFMIRYSRSGTTGVTIQQSYRVV